MLDKYEDEQKRAVTILKNQILNDMIAHAYLFVIPINEDKSQFIKEFIKEILNADEEMSKKIDHETLLDLKVIRPDGMQIKKNQIQELQEEFLHKALVAEKKVYIIEEAEKLNASAANTLLKFLEEPAENIIGILITSNIEAVLATIKSRCSIIYLSATDSDINVETNLKEAARRFVFKYEENGIKTNLYLEELVFLIIKERTEFEKFFQMLIYFYNEILKHKIKKELFADEKTNQIIEKNTIDKLIKKIRILIMTKKHIGENINLKLLIDKLIMLLAEVDNEANSSS